MQDGDDLVTVAAYVHAMQDGEPASYLIINLLTVVLAMTGLHLATLIFGAQGYQSPMFSTVATPVILRMFVLVKATTI